MGGFFAFNSISDTSKFSFITLSIRVVEFQIVLTSALSVEQTRTHPLSDAFTHLGIYRAHLCLQHSPPALSQAIVRSVLSARWIQIVLRQQGYNPVDIKLAILDFAKFALLDREEPYVFLRWQIQMA